MRSNEDEDESLLLEQRRALEGTVVHNLQRREEVERRRLK